MNDAACDISDAMPFIREALLHPAVLRAESLRLSHGRCLLHIPLPLPPRLKWRIVCCKIFCRTTTYNTCRVSFLFFVVFMFSSDFLFIFACTFVLCAATFVFVLFFFPLRCCSSLLFLRVAPCDEE